MSRIFLTLALVFMGVAANAAEPPVLDIRPAQDVEIDDFLWQSRLIIVFADAENDPRFREQLELLTARPADLIERDVIVLTDTDAKIRSEIRRQFRPRGFMMVLVGKDGSILLRKPFPWNAREISRSIDKTPLRQQEIAAGTE